MSPSNNSFRHARPGQQDSVPKDDTRRAKLDRRESLVRSNAIYRRSENPSSSKDPGSQPDFSFLPEHWKDTVLQPKNTSRDSDSHAYVQRASTRDEENEIPIGISSACLEKKATPSPRVPTPDLSPETDLIRESLTKDIEDLAAVAEDLRSELQDYKRLVSSLGSALCSRRGMFLLKAMQYQQQEHPSPALQGGDRIVGLDDVLSISEAADIGQTLDAHPSLLMPDSTYVRICALCNLPRFVRVLSAQTLNITSKHSEFSSEYSLTTCCRQNICDHCFAPAILSSFTKDWWYDLTYQGWIKCPVPGCHSPLPLFYREQVSFLLRQLGDKEYTQHANQFQECSRLRSALVRHCPRPTEDALHRAAALHRQLDHHGRMHNPLSSDPPAGHTIVMMSVDSVNGSQSLQVPIFVDQFILRSSLECIICTEAPLDVVDGSQQDEDRWSAAIDGFPGIWTSQIRRFPSPSDLSTCSASHLLDICRICLDRHITTQLESRGVAACESLTCPSPGCNHSYTHDEVRILVSPETFTRYDKLKLLSNLSTQPDFRWCLREGCGFGQIYQILDQIGDGPLDRRRNHVECEECSFEMCFKHQIPWHKGLSCAEFDRMQSAPGASTNDQATREWLLANAKICRCGAYVEKQGGCFHMTCHSCGFEFCWECMADWKKIQGVNMATGLVRRYNKNAHAPGCWFRGENAILPTQMRGDSIEDALGRMRG